jgi:hypothetical protein
VHHRPGAFPVVRPVGGQLGGHDNARASAIACCGWTRCGCRRRQSWTGGLLTLSRLSRLVHRRPYQQLSGLQPSDVVRTEQREFERLAVNLAVMSQMRQTHGSMDSGQRRQVTIPGMATVQYGAQKNAGHLAVHPPLPPLSISNRGVESAPAAALGAPGPRPAAGTSHPTPLPVRLTIAVASGVGTASWPERQASGHVAPIRGAPKQPVRVGQGPRGGGAGGELGPPTTRSPAPSR